MAFVDAHEVTGEKEMWKYLLGDCAGTALASSSIIVSVPACTPRKRTTSPLTSLPCQSVLSIGSALMRSVYRTDPAITLTPEPGTMLNGGEDWNMKPQSPGRLKSVVGVDSVGMDFGWCVEVEMRLSKTHLVVTESDASGAIDLKDLH